MVLPAMGLWDVRYVLLMESVDFSLDGQGWSGDMEKFKSNIFINTEERLGGEWWCVTKTVYPHFALK